jgi:perosamine synthetase
MKFIPQIQPWIDNDELEEMTKVIKSTYVTENKATKNFEALFRDLSGAKHAVAYANGTLGLLGALLLMDLQPGDEVLVPAMTFIATANAVILAGGTPVLCDIAENSWQVSVDTLEAKLTPKTRGVIPVHLYGQAVDMEAVLAWAKEHNLFVIEDAAQGVGVLWDGQHVGTFGDVGMVSFYGNKTITTAEGAMLFTEKDELAKRLYQLKNHGRSQKGVFKHETIGYNFSFSDIQAALGIAQMKKLDRVIAKKQVIYDRYLEGLGDVAQIIFQNISPRVRPVHWFTNIHVPDAEALETYLREQEIGSRRYFYPMYMQPCYEGVLETGENYPNTLKAYQTGLSLPSSVSLTEEDQDRVIETVRNYFS